MGASWKFRVRWADLDPNRHLRNTAFVDYATETRLAYLASVGFTDDVLRDRRLGPVILREETWFTREVLAGDVLEVDIALAALSADGGRFRLRHEVFRADGEKAARVEADAGWLDLAARRLVRPPADLLAVMNGFPRTDDFESLPDLNR
jgi:acyl-CoA thioester hydrolase